MTEIAVPLIKEHPLVRQQRMHRELMEKLDLILWSLGPDAKNGRHWPFFKAKK
jgi:hypothetical protein